MQCASTPRDGCNKTTFSLKYKHLDSCHFFTMVAIETTGVFGPRTTEFLKQLGLQLRQMPGEANSSAYLTQKLSVEVVVNNLL